MNKSLLLLLLGLLFCFIQCKDNDPEIEIQPPIDVNISGKWHCRDTTTWIGGELPQYKYRTITFDETTFEYTIETEQKDTQDHSIIIYTTDTIRGTYSIDYPTINFTPKIEDHCIGEIHDVFFYLIGENWSGSLKYDGALLFNRIVE